MGAIPHFEFTREYSVESLNFALELAAKHDKLVDVHCDEIDDEPAAAWKPWPPGRWSWGYTTR